MDSREPLAMKKRNRRPKKASTKTQKKRQAALRAGLNAARTEAVPLKVVAHKKYKRAKRHETKRLKRDAWVKQPGEKKLYLKEGEKCPALARVRDFANKAQRGVGHLMTNPFASSSSRASGGDGPGL